MKRLLPFFIVLFSLNLGADLLKIGELGEVLPANSTNWQCVLDSKTKLMWEVKTQDNTLHNTSNTYTWYDKHSGVANGQYSHNCTFYDFCNTWLFVALVNELKLCGYKDWRLPSFSELSTLKIFTNKEPLIDRGFFPNTQAGRYWTSSLAQDDNDLVLDVLFFYGGTSGSEKSFDGYVRVVREQL